MTDRLPTAERRAQIVEATLTLLATTPVDRVTTRQIAEAVGVSQPALFRHFESREALLAAVVEHARAALQAAAEETLAAATPSEPLLAAGRLAQALAEHVSARPGLPRLLFHELASGEAGLAGPLRHLVSAQRAVVAELVRAGQRAGRVPASVDPHGAARLFVAMVQGLLVQWQLAARPPGLVQAIAAGVASWAAGVEAGHPAHSERGEPRAPGSPASQALIPLDVRPSIAAGVDPLGQILAAIEAVAPDGVLCLTAPFRPAPLLALLARRGLRVCEREVLPGTWRVDVLGADAPAPLDLSDLPPPEPLEQVLLACSAASSAPGGGVVLARVPRFPRLLLPRLVEREVDVRLHEELDGSALLHLRVPEAA